MASSGGEIYYLDTSALVKRYVIEPGTNIIDEIFKEAYKGASIISFSYWNIAEATIVFNKYERKMGLNARELLSNLFKEIKTLNSLHRIILVGLSPSIIKNTINLILKHRLYVADALQISSAIKSKSTKFVTADRELAKAVMEEGLNIVFVG